MSILARMAAGLFAVSVMVSSAAAQAFPERPITLVVPYAPGGSTDILARLLADAMTKQIGQSVVVENKGGAGSALGTQFVAQSPADGYTVLLGSSAHTVNPAIRPDITYDPIKDFVPVSRLVTIPHVMVVTKDFPATTVQELIGHARANPGAVNYGSAGPGTSNHLEAELFADKSDTELTHVPYKGIAPAITDLMSGRLQLIIGSLSSLQSAIDSGGAKAIAVTSLTRAPARPDLPTVDESGVKGFETVDWLGLLVPAGTEGAVVEKLAATIQAVFKDDAFTTRLTELGFVPEGSTSAAFVEEIANDVWSATARDLKIQVSN